MMHENDSVFCEMSTDSCHHKATVSLVLSVCIKQSDRHVIHIIIKNNRNINRADMLQLYCMLGIANFDILSFLI